MKRFLRVSILPLALPLALLLLVALPALLLSWGGAPHVALGQTVPPPPSATPLPTEPPPPVATSTPQPTRPPATPLPTQPPVSPLPTARPTRRPQVQPTAPAAPATPRPGADGRVRVLGSVMVRAIGDRRSATVYGYTEEGILFRSDDNGIYWETITEGPVVTDFLFSPANPSLLMSSLPLVCGTPESADAESADAASAAAPLQLSSNSGLTWLTVTDAPALEPLWADAADEARALAAGCDGLYLTEDAGLTWSLLAGGADDPLWSSARAVEIEDADGLLYVLLRAPAATGLAAAAAPAADQIAVSSDGGATWTVISPHGLEPPFAATALAVDPATPGRLWAVGPRGVWVTEDQGQFWGLSASGLNAAQADGLHDIVFHPRELLYVASSAGFFNKRTADLTWRKLGSETVALRIDSLLLAEETPRRLWLNTEIGVYRFLIR